MSAPLRLGLAGLGTVGIGVVRIVQAQADLIAARTGRAVAIPAHRMSPVFASDRAVVWEMWVHRQRGTP